MTNNEEPLVPTRTVSESQSRLHSGPQNPRSVHFQLARALTLPGSQTTRYLEASIGMSGTKAQSELELRAFKSYLDPLLSKHKTSALVTYEDLVASWQAAVACLGAASKEDSVALVRFSGTLFFSLAS